ncbi:MAG: 50S ribosomal protein L22 [Ilumatobacteraceae bacterium]
MTGPKLNEATMVAGERSGTKASAMYLRVSAYKARVVLNLIRGLPVKRADEVLQFSDREVSNDIRKVLASAVANAQHNDEQDPDELFVKACFADEGPTLKRFTPRARGRGNRINKRTCHITIVLARLDDARLEVVQAREAKRTAAGRRRPAAAGTSASRRARVERSRQRAAEARGGTVGDAQDLQEHDHDHDGHDHDHALVDASAFTGELPTGAHAPLDDDSQPEGFEVKGNADSMLYHLPGTPFYDRTIAEVWFDTAENAEAAGYQLPPSQREQDEASDEPAADAADDEGAN